MKFLLRVRKKLDEVIFYSIVLGVCLISLGVYLIGSGLNREIGRNVLICGSGIFYVAIIIFVFRLE